MVFKHLCILVLWTKVASALEGLMHVSNPSPMCERTWNEPNISLSSASMWNQFKGYQNERLMIVLILKIMKIKMNDSKTKIIALICGR